MTTLKVTAVAAWLGASLVPVLAGAATEGVSISDGASVDRSMRQYQLSPPERGVWHNPYVSSGSESGDAQLERIVAGYRAHLDRRAWENPYLEPTATGALVAASDDARDDVGAGSGEPTDAPSAQRVRSGHDFLPTRSGTPATFWYGVAPAGEAMGSVDEEVGGASGEPGGTSSSSHPGDEHPAKSFLPTRSGIPSTFWYAPASARSGESTSEEPARDELGGGSGEPTDASAAHGARAPDFLPARSGTPARLWTGSP